MSYPTKEQALSAAFATAEVGDEVIEHADDCVSDADDDGYCTCEYTVWQLTRSGWQALPSDDPGRIGSEPAISGAWPLPTREIPRIGPSKDIHVGAIGPSLAWAVLVVMVLWMYLG